MRIVLSVGLSCLQVETREWVGVRNGRDVLFRSTCFNDRSSGYKTRKSGEDGNESVEVFHGDKMTVGVCGMLT